MHKFAALLTHGLLMTIEILHLNLLVILVHQNLGCGFILLTILILLSFFNRLNLKQKSLRTNQFQTMTNWLSFMKKIEILGNKPIWCWNFHGICFSLYFGFHSLLSFHVLFEGVVGLFASAGWATSYHATAQRFWVEELGPAWLQHTPNWLVHKLRPLR